MFSGWLRLRDGSWLRLASAERLRDLNEAVEALAKKKHLPRQKIRLCVGSGSPAASTALRLPRQHQRFFGAGSRPLRKPKKGGHR
jgi:hypothetical protein